MNHKIAKTISGDPKSDEEQIIDSAFDAVIKKHDAWDGKNDKENIIAFKRMGVFWLVMVFMKIPHQAMHNVLMSEPSDTFHEEKNAYKN